MSRPLIKNKSFISVWIGNAVSELGGAFGTFCNSIIVYNLTGSTLALGSMWLLYFVPSLILQLFIGPFIDRWSRKWTMIVAQWTRGVIFFIPLISLFVGSIQPWQIYAVQIVIGLITPIYTPANQAITPTIVSKEHLSIANSYMDGTVRLMTFLAPLAAGIVVEYIGVKPTLILVSTLLITSGTLLLFINENKESLTIRKPWLEQFMEGLTYYFKQPIIVWLGIFLAFVQFGVGVTMVITLPYITGELSGSYAQYGYFMAGFPLGYVIGSLLVGKMTFKSRRLLMLGSLVIGGSTFILLGLNQSILLAIIIEGIAGIAMAIFNIHNITICQELVPNHLMGKVTSVRLFIIRATMPLGVLLGSLLGETWGIRTLYLIIGFIICAVSLCGILLPYFKFIDKSIEGNKVAS
ncbi:MFS transporter [Radiobacillus kanasensis]|uniref:MFS transporter n=1 Tax=Radiobacillus kanasensis TaxID=2844358 RepID=UPI001E38046F|nr:MFS transporter [Radiobacillus kanasensis]UFU00102.1 MFS transporter [Radiobacillus kanasensis]